MNEYIEKVHSIISDARLNIKDESLKALNNVKDEEEIKKIKLASIHYETMLSAIILFEKEIQDSIDEKTKLSLNSGVKIVLDKDPVDNEDYSSDTYAYEGAVGAFVSDEDPYIIKTKSGKKIVLDEEPDIIVNRTGKKFSLDEEPKFKGTKTDKIIHLDEDPVSIKTKSGKKIVLDEDPVSKKIKSNKVIVLSEEPEFKTSKTGKVFKLEEDPIQRSKNKFVLAEEPINLTIEDEDPTDDEVTIEFDKLV